jgi:predicted homoserine dehydrogenase-like protein
MINRNLLDSYKAQHGRIKVAIAGAGYISKGLIQQIALVDYIDVVAIYSKSHIPIVALLESTNLPLSLIVNDIDGLCQNDADIVIELTGDTEFGCQLALAALAANKHFVVSAEIDALVGPVLAELFRSKKLIYSNMWGDEPGLINHLYNYADVLGFSVVAVGKFKGFHDSCANPTTVQPWADKSGQKPTMIASFADGSKMSMEMTIVSNATGLTADIAGMHLPKGRLEDIVDIMKLKEQGGILNQTGVIDVICGVEPSGGVYAVITTDKPDILDSLSYYKMGDGPNYLLYQPYHMPGIEMLYGLYINVVEHQSVVQPLGVPVSDVSTFAKRDLKKGDQLDCIGGYDYFGKMTSAESAVNDNALPLGLASGAIVLTDICKGEPILLHQVEIRGHDIGCMLRQQFGEMVMPTPQLKSCAN